MSDRVFFDVDPATLHLPNERIDGADPAKLQRQIAKGHLPTVKEKLP